MSFSESEIIDILRNYDIGSLVRFNEQLEDGFQSENLLILTDKGDFVVRIIFDTEKNIVTSMRIYEYLAKNSIKTPLPLRTKENSLFLPYKGRFVVIQTFIEGEYISDLKKSNQQLDFYGKELGKVHHISLEMIKDLGKDIFLRDTDTISSVKDMAERYPVEDGYISKQYQEWKEEIKRIPSHLLTKAVIHGDIGPKDFFFKDDIFTGIIDFNAAGYDYLLFDIAAMMMYCNLFYTKNIEDYKTFAHAYLEKSPVKKEEFKWLYIILKTRWLLQIYFHQYRYDERITRGLDSGKREENLEGVTDGKHFLEVLEETPQDLFFKVL